MGHTDNTQTATIQPTIYQIRLKGHLGCEWAAWFESLTVQLDENGDTILVGPIADQAALHGVLRKIRDLGMPLLALNTIHPKYLV